MRFIKEYRRLTPIVALLAAVAFFGACATGKKEPSPPPDELLKSAVTSMKQRRFEKGKEDLQKILEEYPNSQERISALMLLGDAHYNDEEYQEAKFHYKKFTEQHPAHKNVDRAHFYKAMADYKLMDIASRDQTPTRNAIEAFNHLINNFPKSEYYNEAVKRKRECEDNLAQNFFQVGKFYHRTHAYQAAIVRLNSFLKEFPEQKYRDEVLFLLADSYYQEQNFDMAQSTFKKLVGEFPKSQFTLEAKARFTKSR
ncbi:MAG: outer membrane protein assembly factor BamD [Nitrospinae bacterium CG11_big_fil_rev_8_21_14_0_20_56_8]|nr:MAG: outer membrane protein assembly factor BamD [Nitrospinae bacterium CG11_big_fil_rev_8_21_14_0_20_56_8]